MRRGTFRPGRARGVRALIGVGAGAALVFGLVACSEPESAPTSIPIPSVIDTGSWGAYGDRADACFGVAGDVLTLALVPNNLSLADPGSGVSDVDEAIRTAGDAAPGAIAPNYRQMSALVRSFGVELSAWSAAEKAKATSPPTPTPPPTGPSSTPSAGAAAEEPPLEAEETHASVDAARTTPTPSPSAGTLPRPVFDGPTFSAQLDAVKAWLSKTCG